MEDLAVAYVQDNRLIGWPHTWGLRGDWRTLVENLLCLLKPVEEELLPPRGPVNCRIWEIFARAKFQQRQWFVVASILRNMNPRLNVDEPAQRPGLPEDHVMVMTIQKGFNHLLASFHAVQRHLERCQLISTELQTNMIIFRARLESCSRSIVGAITRQPWCQPGKYLPRPDENFDAHMTERWQWLSADACKIAEEVGKLPSMSDASEVISLSSWSMISETASDRGPAMLTAHLELESVASHYSVDSDMSCLSGQGGPHCFLPSYLFKHPQAAGATAWVSAQDLQKGTKILAADGAVIEVQKVEAQKTQKLLDLEIDDAVPFTTTPNHRIMVPSDDQTVKAIKVEVGSWVMCSDRMAKKVIGKKEYLVEEQEVLAITFHPDKAVACFLPPEEPVVLSKGLTPKPIRRGGMCRRAARDEVCSVVTMGEYEE
ncbi:unnamed protein product [Effrenium voratum]|uniref:Uncharacterized protein n=1 Tax=Effrenium voratum TaxID=2562239 RepID=A0AA36HN94_9DINO|nr:unnamed protein product [Effrenium voratum]